MAQQLYRLELSHRRSVVHCDAHPLAHAPDLQPVTYLGSTSKDGVRGKFEHALGLESDSRDAEGTHVFLSMDHEPVTAEENQIDSE